MRSTNLRVYLTRGNSGGTFFACLGSKLSRVKQILPLFLLSFLLISCADEEIALNSTSQGTYVINCIEAVKEPNELVLYCADAGQILTGITWESWGGATARGVGRSLTNTCQPNCAEGDFAAVAVDVTLSDLTENQGRQIYSKLNMVYSQPVNGVLEEIFELPVTEFK